MSKPSVLSEPKVWRAHPWIRRLLSWLGAGLGLVIGFLGLVMSGQMWVDDDRSSPIWLEDHMRVLGLFLLGVSFLVPSLAALRNRRRGGLAFLATMPAATFCLAFTEAALWYAEAGNTYSWLPGAQQAILPACVFFIPFALAFLAIRNKKGWAVYSFVGSAVVSTALLSFSEWTRVFALRLAPWSALFLAFDVFWLGTDKLRWAPVLARRPRPLGWRIAGVCAAVLIIGGSDVMATMTWQAVCSEQNDGDWSGPRLVAAPTKS